MRFRTAPETTLLAAADKSVPHVKVEIKNAVGDYQNWFGRLIDVSWGASVDQPIAEARVTLRRDYGLANSLSPFRGDSTLNIGGTAIDAGRDFRISPATTTWGTAATASDFKLVFDGKTADIDFANERMEVLARDRGGLLVQAQIKEGSEFKNDDGRALESVIQDIIDIWGPVGTTLYTPVTPAFLVKSIVWGKGSLFEAIRTAAGSIGWDIRYLWDNTTSAFRLTLFEPDRFKTVPDWTFAKNRILKVTQLRISSEFVRNSIEVTYYNPVSKQREKAFAIDPVSMERFGEQWMQIEEADDSPINTLQEAQALANAALADLAWPIAEKQVEIPFFWAVEVGDLIRFTANDIHMDEDIDLAVTGCEHRIAQKHARTVLTLRGKPAGFYKSWLKRSTVVRPPEEVSRDEDLYDVKVIAQTLTTQTWRARCKGSVDQVFIFEQTDRPIEPSDVLTSQTRPDADRFIYYTLILPTETHYKTLMLLPVAEDLSRGKPWFTKIEHKPDQAPEIFKQPKENGQVGTFWMRVQSRGKVVTTVQAQTQVGTNPLSALVAPTRTAGAASVVNGGILGAGEYEHDVTLDSYRLSQIYFILTLENTGETITVASPAFDVNRIPDFVTDPVVSGTTITVNGDSDTISFKVERVNGGTWVRQIDNWTGVVDVSLTDDTGNAGLLNNTTASYRITLRSDPTADVDVNTFTAVREVSVTRGTATTPFWDAVQTLPPALSASTMTIKLDSSSPNVGYTGKVWYRSQFGGFPFSDWADITASLSPALSSPPPTALTTYTYATDYPRVAKSGIAVIVTVEVRAELLSAGVVVATRTESTNWYAVPA